MCIKYQQHSFKLPLARHLFVYIFVIFYAFYCVFLSIPLHCASFFSLFVPWHRTLNKHLVLNAHVWILIQFIFKWQQKTVEIISVLKSMSRVSVYCFMLSTHSLHPTDKPRSFKWLFVVLFHFSTHSLIFHFIYFGFVVLFVCHSPGSQLRYMCGHGIKWGFFSG